MSGLPLVIANPEAGGGTGRNRWRDASGLVADRLGRHDLVWTEAPGDAERIARAEGSSRPLLIAYGGDGTASEVARGIAHSMGEAELGLLPSGTGNDFASAAGVPSQLPEAARFLSRTPARRTDLGHAEDAAGASRFFLNSFSLGLAASVAERTSAGSSLGRATYAAAAAREVVAFQPIPLRVGLNEKPARPRTLLNLTILNSRRFGAGIPLAPPADPGDGELDAVLVGPLGPVALMDAVFRLTREAHFGRREIEHHRITRAAIGSLPGTDRAPELLSEVDGDVVRWRESVTVSVAPGAVRIRRNEARTPNRNPDA